MKWHKDWMGNWCLGKWVIEPEDLEDYRNGCWIAEWFEEDGCYGHVAFVATVKEAKQWVEKRVAK